MPIIKLPDGSKAKFPDDMTPDQIQGVLDQQFAAPKKGRWVVDQPAPQRTGRWVVDQPPPEVPGHPEPAPPALPPQKPNPEPVSPNAATAAGAMFGMGGYPVDPYTFNPENVDVSAPVAAQAIGRGVADVVATPADVLALPYNLAAEGYNHIADLNPDKLRRAPVVGSMADALADSSSQLAHDVFGFNAKDPEQMSAPDRIGYEALRFGTQGGLGGLGLAELSAMRTAKYGERLGRNQMSFDALLAPYETNAPRAILDDTFAGAGAGAAKGALDALGVKNGLADTAAMLVGGAGGFGAGRAVTSPGKIPGAIARSIRTPDLPYVKIGDAVVPVSNAAADRGASFLQGNLSDPQKFAGDVRSNAAEYEAMGLEPPAIGTLSNDIGAHHLENAARNANPREFAERDSALARAAVENIASVRPPDIKTPGQLRLPGDIARAQADDATGAASHAVRRVEETLSGSKRELKRAQDDAAEIASLYRDTSAARSAGEASRKLDEIVVDGVLQPRTAAKNQKYAAIDPDGTTQRSITPLAQAADDIRKTVGRLNSPESSLPTYTLDKIDAVAKGSGQVTFRDLVKLRPELSDGIRGAYSAGNRALADNLTALKREIGREAERLAAEGGPAGEAAKEANRYFKEEFAPYFGTGTTGGDFRAAINRDPRRVDTPPSQTAERFLFAAPGGKEAAEDLHRILSIAPNPDAGHQAVRNYVVASLSRTLGTSGSPNLNAVKRWRSNWSDTLTAFPKIRDEIDGFVRDLTNNRTKQNTLGDEIRGYGEALKAAESDLAATKQRVGSGMMSVLLDSDPEHAVQRVLNDADPAIAVAEVKRIVDPAKYPEAWSAFKASVTDNLLGRVTAGPDKVDYPALKLYFDKNVDVLAAVYNPDEMNALRRAQKILKPLADRVTSGKARQVESAGDHSDAWRALEVAFKAHYGVLKGGGVLRTLKIALGTLPNEDRAVQAVMTKMIFDPELAAHLATRDISRVGSPKWNARLSALIAGAQGVRGANDALADSEQRQKTGPQIKRPSPTLQKGRWVVDEPAPH